MIPFRAFETVYFWPELAQNFREVYRVLKPGGIFFICNEANGETDIHLGGGKRREHLVHRLAVL